MSGENAAQSGPHSSLSATTMSNRGVDARNRPRGRAPREGTTASVPQPLLRALLVDRPEVDRALLKRAYLTAESMHIRSGLPADGAWSDEALQTASILAEHGMAMPTLVAALLHDAAKRTRYTLKQIRREFGDEVAELVHGMLKLDRVEYGGSAQALAVRKAVVAMSGDMRVLIIKLASRLHGMRTQRDVAFATRERVALETLEVYAPLAHQLGMIALKSELEDLAFAILHPRIYDEIVRMVAERAPSRDQYLAEMIAEVESELRQAKIKASVVGRAKPYYSVYRKMIHRGRDFSNIYDMVGLRVIVEEDRDCYNVLGQLHSRWHPVLGRFKDYVAMPKFNMYQSLHTTLIGPQNRPVEVQIRTHAMHRRTLYGVAADAVYETNVRLGTGTGRRAGTNAPEHMGWFQNLLDWQADGVASEVGSEWNAGEVYLFTPAGDVVVLPAGAAIVDFAYAVHTEIGHRAVGAKVNGRMVPLEWRSLEHGDIVEVFTSSLPNAGPSSEWLQAAQTPRARREVRRWFRHLPAAAAALRGEDELERLLRSEGLAARLPGRRIVSAATSELGFGDPDEAFAAVGRKELDPWQLLAPIMKHAAADPPATRGRQRRRRTAEQSRRTYVFDSARLAVVKNLPNVATKFARCCDPTPEHPIVAVALRGTGIVSIHLETCLRARPQSGGAPLQAAWAGDPRSPGWVKSQLFELRVSYAVRDTEPPDLQTATSPQVVERISGRRSTSIGTEEVIVGLELRTAPEIRTAIEQLRETPGVLDVQPIAVNYLTAGSGKRRSYRDRRAERAKGVVTD